MIGFIHLILIIKIDIITSQFGFVLCVSFFGGWEGGDAFVIPWDAFCGYEIGIGLSANSIQVIRSGTCYCILYNIYNIWIDIRYMYV